MRRTITVGPHENIPIDAKSETITEMKPLPSGSFEVTIEPRDHEAEEAKRKQRAAGFEAAAQIAASRRKGLR